MEKSQHLILLTASNFKRLVAVRIAPSDPASPSGIMRLTGENKAGKSSVLDLIVALLLGKKYIPDEPVHKGADGGGGVLETEDFLITRTFTPGGGGSLKVEDKQGRTYSSPQALLDKLCFTTGFDPLSFARLDEKKQAAMLLQICPVEMDLEANAAQYQKIYDSRRDTKKDLKREEAQLASWTPPDLDIPTAEVKVTDLIGERDALQEKERDRNTLQSDVTDTARDIKQLKEEIERKLNFLKERTAGLKEKEAKLASTDDPAEAIEAKKVEIASAEERNDLFRKWETRRKGQRMIAGLQEQVEKADTTLKNLEQNRLDALAAAKFPIEGLSLSGDGKIMFNDLPFSQASTAEEIQVGICLACAVNPTLRLAFVRDGSLLDKTSLALLDEVAEKHNLQVLIERVDDQSPTAIEIVDGSTIEA